MQKTTLLSINTLKADFSQFTFAEHELFHWSPQEKCVYYNKEKLAKPEGVNQLLHELGHALLGHKNYTSAVQLLKMEAEAWSKAQQLASGYSLKINQKQIDHCLDSYRDWLHLRSSCPNCNQVSTEIDANYYQCFNCFQKWRVSPDQHTRHYRLKLAA